MVCPGVNWEAFSFLMVHRMMVYTFEDLLHYIKHGILYQIRSGRFAGNLVMLILWKHDRDFYLHVRWADLTQTANCPWMHSALLPFGTGFRWTHLETFLPAFLVAISGHVNTFWWMDVSRNNMWTSRARAKKEMIGSAVPLFPLLVNEKSMGP